MPYELHLLISSSFIFFMQCIVLVGFARSGKDTAADYLIKEFNFKKFVFSDVLVKMAKEKNLEPTKMNLVKLGDELRALKGMNAVAIELLKEVKAFRAENKEKETNLVLVGARSKEEFYSVKEVFPEAKLVAVTAKQNERFERKSNIDPQNKEEFFSRDKIDSQKKGLTELISLADYELLNSGTKKDLSEKINELIKT
ncbi:MAG: AAA family ATPase [Candidatus Diapherotrites archaeon]